MKRILLLLLLALPITLAYGQTKRFILVRHAEKQASMLADPALTEEGLRNSQRLAQLLMHIPLQGIYSTPYVRTQTTALPSAQQDSLPVQFYQPQEGKALLDRLLQTEMEGDHNTLIVGHSNTIPELVNHLVGANAVAPMPETDYGKVFLVTVTDSGRPQLTVLQIPKEVVKAPSAEVKSGQSGTASPRTVGE